MTLGVRHASDPVEYGSNPGELLIRFNKSENSKASYLKMKELSKGLRDVLTD